MGFEMDKHSDESVFQVCDAKINYQTILIIYCNLKISMSLQKTNSKLHHVKSQPQLQMPLSSLMVEINELKKELIDIKGKKVIPFNKYQKEKAQLKQECQNHKLSADQSAILQAQKNSLRRELQQSKRQNQKQRKQYNELKTKLQLEEQKNQQLTIKLKESQEENHKLKRSVDFCKSEIQELCQELESLKRMNERSKQLGRQRKTRKKQIEKIKTLDSIKSLIQECRQRQY